MKKKRQHANTVFKVFVFCLGIASTCAATAETWTIPQGSESRESPRASGVPFGPVDMVSQQIFSPGLFPGLSQPGELFQIDGIAFRLASGGPDPRGASASFDRVEIIVSSGNGPFTLALAANHGANQVIVYDGPLTLSGTVPGGTTPSAFDLTIDFESPFIYDRSTGSLIVEIRKSGSGELPALGSAQIPGTTFFYHTDFQGTQSLGDIGLETQFSYQVVPEPSVSTLLVLALFGLMLRTNKRI